MSFNELGLRIHQRLDSEGNLFFSPLSIGCALAALLPGARGETARELAELIGVVPEVGANAGAAAELRSALAPRSVDEHIWDHDTGESGTQELEIFRISLATALFAEEGYPLLSEYRDLLADSFGTDFSSVKFADAHDAARRINDWVSQRTEGRIPTLVSPQMFEERTRLVLANAVYFKARWREAFDESSTRPASPFHRLDGTKVDVPMMVQRADFGYWSDEATGLQSLILPYTGDLSMLVVLPAKGRFDQAARELSMGLLAEMAQGARYGPVDVELPRLELRYDARLEAPLRQLGLVTIFDEASADLSGMSPSPEGLMVSGVMHQAWVRIDEAGTEAAAATAFDLLALSDEPQEATPFIVDRPYYIFIQDGATGAVLFMGRVLDPTA